MMSNSKWAYLTRKQTKEKKKKERKKERKRKEDAR